MKGDFLSMFSCKSLSSLLLIAAMAAGAVGPAVLPVMASDEESGENGARHGWALSLSLKGDFSIHAFF